MTNDFNDKVRVFVREYVPEESLEDFEIFVSNTDVLRETMDSLIADPTREGLEEIHEVAYDFAVSQLEEYRCSQRMIGTIASAHQSVIQEHLNKVAAIEDVPMRKDASDSSDGFAPHGIERDDLISRANAASKAKKKILHGDVRPLRVVLARCNVLVKALSSRAKSEFPAATKPPGWFPEKPISDSSDPNPDPLSSGGSHEVCTLFADGKYKTFNTLLIQRETGKTQAEQRAEAKKARAEQRELAAERTNDLMELRKRKKEQAMEGI